MPLTTLIDLQGAAGWAAILVPFLLLLVALAVALLDPARKAPQRAEPAGGSSGMHTGAAPSPASQRTPDPVQSSRLEPVQKAAPPPVARVEPPSPPAPPPPPAGDAARPAATIPQLRSRLNSAEGAFDNAAVARLSLELARRMIQDRSSGDDIERQLRRSIVAASQCGDTAIHAAARLELGDRVAARGDMTTACEHWQIARQIFWDESRTDGLAEADRRMIAAGCPTDWVLNDF